MTFLWTTITFSSSNAHIHMERRVVGTWHKIVPRSRRFVNALCCTVYVLCCCKNCGKKWQQEKWKMITLYTITIPRLGCSILLLGGRGLVLKMPWFACGNMLSENFIGNLSGKSLFPCLIVKQIFIGPIIWHFLIHFWY